MKLCKTLLAIGLTVGWYGCSPDGSKQRAQEAPTDPVEVTNQPETHGIEIKEVELTTPLDQGMAKAGLGIYDVKCGSCHKLDESRIVGPGWKGVTQRRKPGWIMNMITNVDMMLEKDPEA
ncbi:MAG: cytochrome c, partial [Rudanella sp.]|nr:cytochrome c [Rudanella sp.]